MPWSLTYTPLESDQQTLKHFNFTLKIYFKSVSFGSLFGSVLSRTGSFFRKIHI